MREEADHILNNLRQLRMQRAVLSDIINKEGHEVLAQLYAEV